MKYQIQEIAGQLHVHKDTSRRQRWWVSLSRLFIFLDDLFDNCSVYFGDTQDSATSESGEPANGQDGAGSGQSAGDGSLPVENAIFSAYSNG